MKIINYHKIEIWVIIIISFSPLISQEIKASITLLLLILNYRIVIIKKIFSAERRIAIFVLLFIINLTIDSIIKGGGIEVIGLYFPLTFIFGYVISKKYSVNEFLEIAEGFIFLTCIFSFIGVFIFTYVPYYIKFMPDYYWNSINHKTFLLFNILTPQGYLLRRNTGIAWEPGAYQLLLNMGLYTYTMINKKTSIVKISIYILAIYTTKSTVGLLLLLFQVIIISFKDKKYLIFLFFTSIIFSSEILNQILYQANYKLYGSETFNIRFMPFYNTLLESTKYIFGMGNARFNNYFRNFYRPAYDSVGQIAIRYGLPFLLFINFILIKITKISTLLFLIIFITFFSQNIWYLPFITPFYFWEYKKTRINKLNLQYTMIL